VTPPNPKKLSSETAAQREARIQRLLREVEKQLREALPELDQPLEKIEQDSLDLGRKVQEIVERDTLESLGHGYLGSHVPCACGAPARFVTQTARVLVTLNGVRRLRRAYYHCAACQKGFCPLDQWLQLGAGECSIGVRVLAARFASYLPFRKAAEELELVCGVRLSAGTVRRCAQGVGAAIGAAWAERERRLWAGEAPPVAERPRQVQIGMDGVLIRIGKEWKEVKVGEVYQPKPKGGVGRIQYYATRGDAVAFGRRLRTLAQAEGVSFCRAVGTVGDGIDWIWQEAAKHFPRAEEILDYYHALQHLWQLAHARFGKPEEAHAWIDQQQKRLLEQEEGIETVIQEVEAWEPTEEEASKVKRRVGNYLRSHAHRMEYKRLREQGYHIGSGVVEAGCKNVVQARLKGTGMRWSEAGAEAMLYLRASVCSTGSTDFRAVARAASSVS
jgi:hypothetical protein